MFETEENFKKPIAFLKKRGVKKVGNKDAVTIEETAEAVEICSISIVKYYYKDRVEESKSGEFCVVIPKTLWAAVKRRLEKVIV